MRNNTLNNLLFYIVFNNFTFPTKGGLNSLLSTTESLETQVLTPLLLSTDAVFTQETCSLISGSEKNMWHAGIQGIYRSYRLEATQINTDDQHFY